MFRCIVCVAATMSLSFFLGILIRFQMAATEREKCLFILFDGCATYDRRKARPFSTGASFLLLLASVSIRQRAVVIITRERFLPFLGMIFIRSSPLRDLGLFLSRWPGAH